MPLCCLRAAHDEIIEAKVDAPVMLAAAGHACSRDDGAQNMPYPEPRCRSGAPDRTAYERTIHHKTGAVGKLPGAESSWCFGNQADLWLWMRNHGGDKPTVRQPGTL